MRTGSGPEVPFFFVEVMEPLYTPMEPLDTHRLYPSTLPTYPVYTPFRQLPLDAAYPCKYVAHPCKNSRSPHHTAAKAHHPGAPPGNGACWGIMKNDEVRYSKPPPRSPPANGACWGIMKNDQVRCFPRLRRGSRWGRGPATAAPQARKI